MFYLRCFQVVTRVPFLLRGQLREYQHVGLDWLVSLYNNKMNGILADEMGLGKTIQTIAFLAHLAGEEHNWGPHLVIVPTSVLLNWELEFKRWCPGFIIKTYYGSRKQRADLRTVSSYGPLKESVKLEFERKLLYSVKAWNMSTRPEVARPTPIFRVTRRLGLKTGCCRFGEH